MSENKIKFTHAPDGEVDCCNGHTVYSSLFTLGAFALTSKLSMKDGSNHYEYATDAKGLETLIEKSHATIELMQHAISALGLVMTDEESEHVQENRCELNWLVVGLSELSIMVANNLSGMNSALRSIQANEAKK